MLLFEGAPFWDCVLWGLLQLSFLNVGLAKSEPDPGNIVVLLYLRFLRPSGQDFTVVGMCLFGSVIIFSHPALNAFV